jgi:hypothetical protein
VGIFFSSCFASDYVRKLGTHWTRRTGAPRRKVQRSRSAFLYDSASSFPLCCYPRKSSRFTMILPQHVQKLPWLIRVDSVIRVICGPLVVLCVLSVLCGSKGLVVANAALCFRGVGFDLSNTLCARSVIKI